MVGLSAQQVLRQRMDLTANNLANMTTTGFKAEHLVTRELSEQPANATEQPKDIAFVDAWMLQRDFKAGPMERTGNPLDVAIEGEGFFSVATPAGEAFTRDGAFSIGPDGTLVSRSGHAVMGDGGPIALNTAGGPVTITGEGSIMQDGVTVGRLKVSSFQTPGALEKIGNNLWKATDEAPATPEQIKIASGFLEGSNVNAVLELTKMIEISRTYESVASALAQADQLRSQSIEKLTHVS